MYLKNMTKPHVASVAHVPMGPVEPITWRIKHMAACDSLSAFAGKLPTLKIRKETACGLLKQIRLRGSGSADVIIVLIIGKVRAPEGSQHNITNEALPYMRRKTKNQT